MANVWFTSDLHFGHKNIHTFRLEVASEEDNRTRIIKDWQRLVTKRDDVYVLGDTAFTYETLAELGGLAGRKFLVRGNHDEFEDIDYYTKFANIYGLKRYKEFWLSHAPIHPAELRGKINLHGHVHYHSIQIEIPTSDVEPRVWKDDPRYLNLCVESLWKRGFPSLISLDQIRQLTKGITNE